MNSNTTGLILIIAAPKPPVNKAAKIVNLLEVANLPLLKRDASRFFRFGFFYK